jgi:hypothetical protein
VLIEKDKHTNPKAANLISSTPLNGGSVSSCELAKPYFDGVACVACPSPFTLFDMDTKKCVQCQAEHFYDNSSLQCKKRPVVRISTNFNNLVATKTLNMSSYKA